MSFSKMGFSDKKYASLFSGSYNFCTWNEDISANISPLINGKLKYNFQKATWLEKR